MSFFDEIRRRDVLRTAVLYGAAAWLVMQVVNTVEGWLGLPTAVGKYLLLALAVGFPIAIFLSWMYRFSLSGVTAEEEPSSVKAVAQPRHRTMDTIIIAMLSAAVVLFAIDKWWAGPPPESSIAVLAFENMSADPEQEYFSDGISEELLNTLANMPGLTVISRKSAFSFKGRDISIAEIAERLNVVYVLVGSVRKAGNRVRITAQLIDARSDSTIWSEPYDRELTAQDIFTIQGEIAAEISEELGVVLNMDDRSRISQAPTQNTQAHEAYLLGLKRLEKPSSATRAQAITYFEKAVSLDPKFAIAHAELASANFSLGYYGGAPMEQALVKARKALDTALSLDKEIAKAYIVLGRILSLQNDMEGADSAYKKSLELSPNNAGVLNDYADFLMDYMGQPAAAIPLLEKARVLSPMEAIAAVTLGQAHVATGNFAKGIAMYRKAIEIQPDNIHAPFTLTAAYLGLGDDATAEYWTNRLAATYPEESNTLRVKLWLHLYRNERQTSLRLARDLRSVSPASDLPIYVFLIYGEYQEVIQSLAPSFPELSCDIEAQVTQDNLGVAMNLSLALQETGQESCAERLLDKILERLLEMRGHGYRRHSHLFPTVYARQGKTKLALAKLSERIESGMTLSWWLGVERSPHMTSLRDNPELNAMMSEVDMMQDAQRAILREMEANGELAPIAEL